ncbi:hypothetical protein Tsubulata_018161 [Turnera subulata]|uniref:Reticulon-like protein n=1 Tax=Turnera subulata TaxID=218843 RepID=A0A9Q0G2I2_9ROSI|nr:hypothetical protein Tsubulata_018161 [Turnera subulata]
MDVSRRRTGVKTSVVAGSVWESRMRFDDVKGGIKVFNGDDNPDENADSTPKKVARRGQSATSATVASSGKRKTWKSESFDGPIQIAKGKTIEEQGRELSVSVDGGIKKGPIQQGRKLRSDGGKELSASVDGIDKSSIQVKKGRSEGSKENPVQVKRGRSGVNKEVGVSSDGNEKSPIQTGKVRSETKEVVESRAQLRKVKSDSENVANQSTGEEVGFDDDGIEKSSVQLRKVKSETDKVVVDESISGTEKSPPETEEPVSEESCKDFGVCQEKVISSSTETNEAVVNPQPEIVVDDEDDDDNDEIVTDGDDEEFEGDEEEEIGEETEIEIVKTSFEIKEINVSDEKSKKEEANVPEQKPKTEEKSIREHKPKTVEKNIQEPRPKKMEASIVTEQRPKRVDINLPEQRLKQVVNEEKKVHQFRNRSAPTSSTVNKQPPPVLRRATIYENITRTASSKPASIPVVNEYQNFPQRHNKLQNLVDLVMWRDISRSAFVFGIGTFIIISSSYTKDLNVSFISVISYLGLVYLAAIFLYRSLISREVVDIDDNTSYVVGEHEAIWLMKLILPYLNEFLLKIRALFSGDPATTMKMAVLLFVFARCGSSITIWKMAKLGFFGVFVVPKVCSSYSAQLTAYGKFWIRRFRDAWDSCTHKKAVALGMFTLVWNLSSTVARVWAVFMMFVAVRYYQRCMESEEYWVEDDDDDARVDETSNGHTGGLKQEGFGLSSVELTKAKKAS